MTRRPSRWPLGWIGVAIRAAVAWPATRDRPVFASWHGSHGRPWLIIGVGFGHVDAATSTVEPGDDRAWRLAAYRRPAEAVPIQRDLLDRKFAVRPGIGGSTSAGRTRRGVSLG